MTGERPRWLRCPCGELIAGPSEDALVDAVNEHLDRQHPNISGRYSRDEILFLAAM